MKKFLSILLTMALCLSMSTNVFAADPVAADIAGDVANEIPAGAVKNTVTVTLDPHEEADIMPLMWDQVTDQSTKQYLYLVPFIIPDRYFAYEMEATGATGRYAVSLMYNSTATIASQSGGVNNGSYKIDWIEVTPGNTYQFRVNNGTGGTIAIKITYYSWK